MVSLALNNHCYSETVEKDINQEKIKVLDDTETLNKTAEWRIKDSTYAQPIVSALKTDVSGTYNVAGKSLKNELQKGIFRNCESGDKSKNTNRLENNFDVKEMPSVNFAFSNDNIDFEESLSKSPIQNIGCRPLKISTTNIPIEPLKLNKACTSECCRKINIAVNSADKPFQCNFCSKRFSCKQNCERHFRTHTNDKPFDCSVCGRKFPFQRSRDRHYRTHTNVKAYQCNVCNKRFSRNQGLKSHYLTHTKEKPHQCEICFKRFPRKGSLRQHYRLHTNEKPYDCEACGKSFALKRNRDKHFRVVHMHIKPFQCRECGKSFTCKTTLACHYSTHTNEKSYSCEICSKRYSHKASLTLHYKQHPISLDKFKDNT